MAGTPIILGQSYGPANKGEVPVKDALHVPVVLVRLVRDNEARAFNAGEPVIVSYIATNNDYVAVKAVGGESTNAILDPFLTGEVQAGLSYCYALMRPGVEVKLRHDWQHPDLDDSTAYTTPEPVKQELTASEKLDILKEMLDDKKIKQLLLDGERYQELDADGSLECVGCW